MKSRPKASRILLLILVIFIFILLVFSKKEMQKRVVDLIMNMGTGNRELTLERTIFTDCHIDDGKDYGEDILIWGDNRLIKFDSHGYIIWEKEFDLIEAKVFFGEKKVYIFERDTGRVFILNTGNMELDEYDLDTYIYNVVEDSGRTLIHAKQENEEKISILKNDGIIDNPLIERENILNYCFDIINDRYAFANLNIGEGIVSHIQSYNMDDKCLWTSYLEGQIILSLNFIDKDNLIVLSDEGLYLINDGNILWKKSFREIKDIHVNDEIHLLHGNSFEIISLDGRTKEIKSLTEGYRRILLFDRYMVLYGENNIVGLRKGEYVFEYRANESILNILQNREKLIIIYRNKIDIISL